MGKEHWVKVSEAAAQGPSNGLPHGPHSSPGTTL